MIATHRVKDSDNSTIGFIIDGLFYTDYYIKENIKFIDNLTITKDGIIRAKKELPEVKCKTAINIPYYKELTRINPFKRDIQNELISWKASKNHKVLQLDGSRQIGKTTELKKFAYKNYEYVIFVDLSSDIFNFVDVIKNGCRPLEIEKYCRRAGLPHFKNNKNTILIIDEIQNSAAVYNSIRPLHEELNCDIIVTGSYLGRILGKKEFFLPAGTVSYAHMFTLSFQEFCRVFKCEEILNTLDIFGGDTDDKYEKLERLYQLYIKIGGYPEVVKTYKDTKDINACYDVINKLLQTFKDESRVYFDNTREVEIFENVYREAVKEMCSHTDITGKNILEKLTTLVKENTELMVNRKEVADAVVWLKYAGIISLCNLAIDGDMRKIAESRRMYFSDCGIMSFLGSQSMIAQSSLTGVLAETFVYNELHRLFKMPFSKAKVIESEVCFSTYGAYELDFMIADKDKTVYGIEVKANDGEPKSLRVFIDKKLVNKGIVAKKTKGGHGDKYDTIPIYVVGCRFPYH